MSKILNDTAAWEIGLVEMFATQETCMAFARDCISVAGQDVRRRGCEFITASVRIAAYQMKSAEPCEARTCESWLTFIKVAFIKVALSEVSILVKQT